MENDATFNKIGATGPYGRNRSGVLRCLLDIKWTRHIGNWVYESEIQGSNLAWRYAFGYHSHMNVRKLVTDMVSKGVTNMNIKISGAGAMSWVTPGQRG